jgi:hypothetical protein
VRWGDLLDLYILRLTPFSHPSAQWSTTLQNEDWDLVTDTGTAPEHIFSVPIDNNAKFLRLLVE